MHSIPDWIKKTKPALPFFFLFLCTVLCFFSYGWEYYPQLDDFIQYHNYEFGASISDFWKLAESLGMLSARPLAGLSDLFVWSWFWGCLPLIPLILAALHTASCGLFYTVFHRRFSSGWLFPVLFLLPPLGLEASYWISAATRIIPAVFFSGLGLFFFDRYLDSGKAASLAASLLFPLLSFCYYEQAIPFTVLLYPAFALLCRNVSLKGRLWSAVPAGIALLYLFCLSLLPESALYGDRSGLVQPFGNWYWTVFLPDLLSQLKSVFLEGNFALLTRGLWRSLSYIITDGLWLFALLILILVVLLFFSMRDSKKESSAPGRSLILGLLLIPTPWLPFFVLENPWFSFRCAAFSFCGIALAADSLLRLASERRRRWLPVSRAAAAGLALVFCLCSVAELHDYRETASDDLRFGEQILSTLQEDGVWDPGLRIGILNLEPSYLEDSTYTYHEHIHGVTESEWALTGYLTCLAEKPAPSVAPLPSSPMYRAWNRSVMLPDTFDALYLLDQNGDLIRVTAVLMEDGFWELTDQSGQTVGSVRETDGIGFLIFP
ncbi:MAG: hypothetical protein J5938_04885 [Clostridia bacterium]|nr:hypothetical protein [Clostridia bacterium]